MDHALKLDVAERTRRRDRDLPYISERPSSLWTRQVRRGPRPGQKGAEDTVADELRQFWT